MLWILVPGGGPRTIMVVGGLPEGGPPPAYIIQTYPLVQPGKSYRAIRTGELNGQTLENSYVIASIEAPLNSAAQRPKFVISILAQHFFETYNL
jgi:hypothetical protein